MGSKSGGLICNAATGLLGRNLNLAIASSHKTNGASFITEGAE